MQSDQKLGQRGDVLVIPVLEEQVLEHHSGLRPSEKEFLELRSGAFHHKNTRGYTRNRCAL